MKISVAMATFNGERFLREQLESLAAQHRLPDELVVCDDGSSDGTMAILEQFAACAPFPVLVHRNECNLGYIANFGKALALASGDLIFLSDQDDVWFADKVAVFEERARAEPSALLFLCDSLLCDEALTPGARLSENFRRLGGRPDRIVAGSCTAIRRELLSVVLPVEGNGPPYDDWIHLIAEAIDRRKFIDRPLQFYRRHHGNVTSCSSYALEGISRASRLRYFLDTSLQDPVPQWLQQLEYMDRVHGRLIERRRELQRLIGRISTEHAISMIGVEMEDIRVRISIVKLGRVGRIPNVLNHYRNGGYGRNSGLVSAVKDLVRPRSPELAA